MLDQMRKHSRSFIIYIFFGIIIAVFVVNFGPQSQGCGAETSYAGQINGEPLTVGDLSYALSVAGFSGQGMSAAQLAQVRAYAIDRLVIRELLAAEAQDMGLRISDEVIRDMLLDGRYLALGMPRRLIGSDDEPFDYERFSKFVRFNWRITVRKFKAQQRRELLAEQLLELLRVATKASPEEARRDFIHRNTRADLSYVRFDPRDPSQRPEPTAQQIEAYVRQQAGKIKEHFESHKISYTNRPEELRLQVIAIAHDKAGGKEAAQKKGESLRERLVGGADFARLAQQHSDHPSAAKGGVVGWVKAAEPGFGAAAKSALKDLEDSAISAVVEGETQTLLLKLEGRRKGDLTLAQVREEIARQLSTEQLANERAKAAIASYITQLQQGKKLEELFAGDTASVETDELGEPKPQAPKPAADPPEKRPELQSTGLFERSAEHLVPGIGISEDLTKLAFQLKQGAIVDHAVSVGNVYYLVAIKERDDPNLQEWKSRQEELVEEFEQRKWANAKRQLESGLCERAIKEKRVQIDVRAATPGGLSAAPDPSDPTQRTPSYVPCQTLRSFSG